MARRREPDGPFCDLCRRPLERIDLMTLRRGSQADGDYAEIKICSLATCWERARTLGYSD